MRRETTYMRQIGDRIGTQSDSTFAVTQFCWLPEYSGNEDKRLMECENNRIERKNWLILAHPHTHTEFVVRLRNGGRR